MNESTLIVNPYFDVLRKVIIQVSGNDAAQRTFPEDATVSSDRQLEKECTMFRSIARKAALAATLAVLSAPLAAQNRPSRSASLLTVSAAARPAAAVVDAFHAALGRGDTRTAASLLADDALVFEGGGVERSKAEYASHHLQSDADFSKAVPAVKSRRAGHALGAIAWIATEGRTKGTYKGKPVDRVTAETMVLRRAGNSWKIVHIHWSSAAPRQ